ncbi:MAG: uroporphyrinogen-III synthase [Bacteroidetes bacterium]|jgi:uroporphyrinogen-III synthase|nr:uroporphyrinogen-III synthase [Bacteroidota bacterium]
MAAKKKTATKKTAKKPVKNKASKPTPAKKKKETKNPKAFGTPKKAIKTVSRKPVAKPAKVKPVKAEVPKIEKEKKVIANTENKEPIDKALPVKRTRKSSKKPVITLPPPPKIEVSNHPKNKVKNIMVSQPKPVDTDKNPYFDLARKHNLNVTFRQFIRVEGLSSQDFRAQRIDILEHGAVILTSKLSVDHYFKMCNEMRVTVPEGMKYFCINEQTAYYLQKYIQYRKRKIFFGHGTMLDLVDVIRKNKDEKFLLPVSDVHKEQIVEFLDELQINYTKGVFYKTVSADLSDIKSLAEFDILVFFTPAGIKSLKANFPNFKQGNTRIAAFGHTAAMMVREQGYRLDIFAPNPQNPSMTGALDAYIKDANKR